MQAAELITQQQMDVDFQTRVAANDFIAQAHRVPEIVTDEQLARASDLVKALLAHAKKIEAERKELKEPVLEAGRRIDRKAKAITDPIEAAVKLVKAQMLPYMERQDQWAAAEQKFLRDEEERLRMLEAEEAERRAAEARALGDHIAAETAEAEAEEALSSAVAPIRERKVGPARGDFGSVSSLKRTGKFDIFDFAALPDAYKLPNDKLLGELARAEEGTQPKIPGVRWYRESQVATR